MTTLDALKSARDAAFARYLAVRKAGGTSRAKKRALVLATMNWLDAARDEQDDTMDIGDVKEYHNRHILHVWHTPCGYQWQVCRRGADRLREVDASEIALPLECALREGRKALQWAAGRSERQ